LALNGTVAAQGGQKRGPDTPSTPRRLTTDPCNKVSRGGYRDVGDPVQRPPDRLILMTQRTDFAQNDRPLSYVF